MSYLHEAQYNLGYQVSYLMMKLTKLCFNWLCLYFISFMGL